MKLHREGTLTIVMTLLFVLVINVVLFKIDPAFGIWNILALVLTLVLLVIILQFFRNPARETKAEQTHIVAPADGKVVVIEEVEESEHFKDKRIQLSIFMSPFDVHVNRYPISGTVTKVVYHPGLYLVAWHPKSSTENERSTVVVEHANGQSVLFRQIAGAMAKRIVCYSKLGDKAVAGAEMGFIKFGSRVDVFLPVGTKLNVKIGDVVKGGVTILGSLS
ncbi:MAG TPA: phosphatidylserine decarboxylase family protein [Bacteroidia bacterium]|nr:phosphatidylserine decarboxylase family protein [Bacteroidia bacterium]